MKKRYDEQFATLSDGSDIDASLKKALDESNAKFEEAMKKKDAEAAAQLNRAAGHRCVDLTGQTEIGEAIDLMSLAASVVTNDSGLMHVAAAVGCRVVAIYGSSSDGFTPPLTDNCARLSLSLECQPCFKRECPLKHLNCLTQLEPEMVVRALAQAPA